MITGSGKGGEKNACFNRKDGKNQLLAAMSMKNIDAFLLSQVHYELHLFFFYKKVQF